MPHRTRPGRSRQVAKGVSANFDCDSSHKAGYVGQERNGPVNGVLATTRSCTRAMRVTAGDWHKQAPVGKGFVPCAPRCFQLITSKHNPLRLRE
eukprot:g2224.t1